MAEDKYRITLTEAQLTYLLSRIEQETQPTLHKYFRVFMAKMHLGAVSAAFTSIGRKSVEERLEEATLSGPERRLLAYTKYQDNPRACSTEEVKFAKTYMYENDLMTPAEEEEFEHDQI